LALTSALAFDQLRRYAAEGAALTEASATILGYTELEPLAQALCRIGTRLVLADRACVYARRGDKLIRIGYAAQRAELTAPETLPCDDARAQAELAEAFAGAPLAARPLTLPVHGERDEGHGLLVVTRPAGYPFERSELRLLDALVTLAALALRNVDFYEQSTQANRALAESNSFKDDLMAMFAHDFRGPLTVIYGFCELLLETEDADVRKGVLTIVEQTKRLGKLSEDALALAATQSAGFSLQRSPADISEFIREIVEPLAHGTARVRVEAPAEPVVLPFDRSRLRHAIENVVGNALKYSSEAVDVRVAAGAGEVRVDVIDRGIGIKPDELERVFVRFGRGSNARSQGFTGSGVGLYIAKKIVEVHGGRLTVASRENEGSTFTIVLPLVP
jgi:signal transduction histidine kinase